MSICIGRIYKLKKGSHNFYGEYVIPVRWAGDMFVAIRTVQNFDRELFINYEYILSNYYLYEHGDNK